MRVIPIVLLLLLAPAAPASAKPRDAKPVVSIQSIQAIGSNEGGTEHRITIAARDPDGIVSELEVDFGDGVRLFILLACTDPGEQVVQEIDWTYAPGKYRVRALGYSTSGCFEGSFQTSRVDKQKLRVR